MQLLLKIRSSSSLGSVPDIGNKHFPFVDSLPKQFLCTFSVEPVEAKGTSRLPLGVRGIPKIPCRIENMLLVLILDQHIIQGILNNWNYNKHQLKHRFLFETEYYWKPVDCLYFF